ncbi:GNAT family N-acetyltransferase [Sorangium sp. So ce1078]|uniref:GNAT family N-acetyltransferase n=1 Tax=Sorangium sp. So ce1078 TaxID=3133329 RepID=UPI003F648CB7
MSDMLVNLLKLPPLEPVLEAMRRASIVVRRAAPYESTRVRRFVEQHFTEAWADEISVGYANKPVSVYLAIRDGEVIGFSAYECTRRGFFGPTGVADSERGQGVGKALLLASLHGLAQMGYAYGIIGGVGPAEFYARTVGATLIPDSTPGVYADPLSTPAPRDGAEPPR